VQGLRAKKKGDGFGPGLQKTRSLGDRPLRVSFLFPSAFAGQGEGKKKVGVALNASDLFARFSPLQYTEMQSARRKKKWTGQWVLPRRVSCQ